MTNAGKLLEALNSVDLHDDKESRTLWNELEENGCYDFVKRQMEEAHNSEFSSKLSANHELIMGFLRGSVYGYVYAKTGDRQYAIRVAEFSVKTVMKEKK